MVELIGATNPYATTTNSNGQFSFNLPPFNGNAVIRASQRLHLPAERSVAIRAGETLQMEPIGLWAGDMDGDQDIDETDWYICAAASIPVSYPAFDLNGDGTTDIEDCTLVANNVGTTGPTLTNPTSNNPNRVNRIESITPSAATPTNGSANQNTLQSIDYIDYIRQQPQDDGSILFGIKGFDQPIHAIGMRIRVPAGVTVTEAEMQGVFGDAFVSWEQRDQTLYLVTSLDNNETLTHDSDIVRFGLDGESVELLTIEAVNLITESAPPGTHTIYLPTIMNVR